MSEGTKDKPPAPPEDAVPTDPGVTEAPKDKTPPPAVVEADEEVTAVGRAHPGVASVARGSEPSAEPWGFLVRAMAYETLVVLVTAASVAALAFVASLLLFSGQLQDIYLRLRGGAPVTGDVALVTIGPEALYLYDPDDPAPSETPRELLAEVVRFLDAADASVVVLDFLLDRPRPADPILADAARAHGAVVAAERFQVTEHASGRAFAPGIPPVLEEVMASGFANFQEEASGLWSSDLLVRRVPLVHVTDRAHLTGPWPMNQVGGKQDIDQIVPAMSLLAAWLYRARQSDPSADRDDLMRLLADGCGGSPFSCDVGTDALSLPALPRPLSEPLDINFRGPEQGDGLVTVDAARILRVTGQYALMRELGVDEPIEVPADLRAHLEGRVVVVGRVDTPDGGSADRFVTPYSLPLQAGADMSGPRIHAHVIDTLLSGRHIRHVGGWFAWIVGLGLAAAVVGTYDRIGDTVHGIGWLVMSVGLLLVGFAVFAMTDGTVLDVGPAVSGCLLPLGFLHLRGWVREQAGLRA